MNYYSLNRQSPTVSFAEAAVKGQAPDKGLYFPEHIPQLPANFIQDIRQYSKEEIGFLVMKPYVAGSLPDDVLQKIVKETVDFEFPLVQVNATNFSLELFHGPTLAFKDVGARFMSRCLGYFNRNSNNHVTVLVATSGDTGGAVANGFLGVEGVDVVILYPSGKVSPVQELQLTTCGQNITALEVDGSFDDCQAMVKQAFADAALNEKISLTSANSINVARWLPQQLYYFFAFQQWQETTPPVISVPSGNFGNICAGILAHISGLPVQHFVAACNANDVIPSYFTSGGNYQPKQAVATLSNAMDVGNPSNFIRVLELFGNQFPAVSKAVSAYSVDDETTLNTIKDVYEADGYILDPHGAVAYHALCEYVKDFGVIRTDYEPVIHNPKGIFLETAHPVKFPEAVEKATGQAVPVPDNVKHLFDKEKQSIKMSASFNDLKDWLMSRK
ncbi:threonine synthase [Filimonas effusa]|uniref:Threonine synthase n=1 Tax=Filimonas effusa TaxID=2508721 RepID=A0A4Q1D4C3_9BACT|nr:threonine synthase [Filimonas effusa]RXK82776.1 threonine synthase [Filimonas effusa]